jgi:hypothetical protein
LGTVEFPPSYFDDSEVRPGHDVVLRKGDKKMKIMLRSASLLGSRTSWA